ncbi:hypothetical protein E1B28_011747 [Marasmius oreades]|uniref:Ubiquitin-like protease family profile domain-containing protein n=1 Tax=Marasmius oreades TaxID=181124 RepID=A0A9P7USF6_9AGAR|nr:uncharacterized protein E1B28_011747 [Marasmius oreades]KAG7090139.1 hypothetical protein E1B28_011747 [Marasmius oreades]
MSVRSHAPTRLRKELAKILQLQSEIDTLEETIAATKHAIVHSPSPSTNVTATLPQLENAHTTLKAMAEDLYLSLNISEGFPELKTVPFDYLQLLLLTRDLKINIRKRGIGSFFEWDKLDHAVGGGDFALAHQLTCKSISKRAPALQNSIKKYNQYIEKLKAMHKSTYSVPIPRLLPTTLAALRDPETSHLWEDVWIARSDCEVAPRWLVDESVRSGIRAMLMLDRCREERSRLEDEARNMSRWYHCELFAIKAAFCSAKYQRYKTLFSLLLQGHLQLALWWANPLLSLSQLQAEALTLASVSPRSTYSTLDGHECEPDEFDVGEELDVATTDHYLTEILDEADGDEEEGEVEREEGKQKDDQVDGSIQLVWAVPSDPPVDTELLPLLKTFPHWPVAGRMSAPRVIHTTLGVRHVFTVSELDRMDDSTCRLSSDCVNGLAAILQDLLARDLSASGTSISSPRTAQDVAILSTYLVPKVFSEGNNAGIWRLTKSTKFWTALTWILPIHDTDIKHWMLAIIYLKSGRVHLFDSLGSMGIWDDWLPKIHIVVHRLIATANDHGVKLTPPTPGWIAWPLMLQRLQSNDYDCGVWILFVMTAILRGKIIPTTTEKEIMEFRSLLVRLIRYLPLYKPVSASSDGGEDDFILL